MRAHTTTCSSWQLPGEEAETLPTENLFTATNAGNLHIYSCWNYIAQWLAPNCSLLPDYPTPPQLSALFWGNNLTRELSSQLSPIGSRCAILQKDAYVFIKLRCDWNIEWKPMHQSMILLLQIDMEAWVTECPTGSLLWMKDHTCQTSIALSVHNCQTMYPSCWPKYWPAGTNQI